MIFEILFLLNKVESAVGKILLINEDFVKIGPENFRGTGKTNEDIAASAREARNR